MTVEEIFRHLMGGRDDEQAAGFLRFISEKLWKLYDEYLMNKTIIARNEVEKWNVSLPNARENAYYSQTVDAPALFDPNLKGMKVRFVEVKGVDRVKHGVDVSVADDGESFTIEGKPSLEYWRAIGEPVQSTVDVTIRYKVEGPDVKDGENEFERKLTFVIIQSPRKLWNDYPVDWDSMPEPKYVKDDTQCEYVIVPNLADGTPQKDIVAASKRGRSHAHEGKPRDDHFTLHHDENTNWYVMAVADGAGSAKFSREGSRIACETAVEHCKAMLAAPAEFEEQIKAYHEQKESSEGDARKKVGDSIYRIVGGAAFKAQKAIFAEAEKVGMNPKLYAATLLLSICKRFEFGWFVASFWVGDGAICLYDRESHTARLLGTPDEGEYAGQTRFLTMPEITRDATSFYKRLRFIIVPDFTALFLMSDGVSDPEFETDANLNNPDKWDALWNNLVNNPENPVDLSPDNEAAKEQLLAWLDFWSPGNHDDRTIAILY